MKSLCVCVFVCECHTQGDQAFVSQDYQSAADAYSVSLRHDTHNAVVWANRAAAYIKLGTHTVTHTYTCPRAYAHKQALIAWIRVGARYRCIKRKVLCMCVCVTCV